MLKKRAEELNSVRPGVAEATESQRRTYFLVLWSKSEQRTKCSQPTVTSVTAPSFHGTWSCFSLDHGFVHVDGSCTDSTNSVLACAGRSAVQCIERGKSRQGSLRQRACAPHVVHRGCGHGAYVFFIKLFENWSPCRLRVSGCALVLAAWHDGGISTPQTPRGLWRDRSWRRASVANTRHRSRDGPEHQALDDIVDGSSAHDE